MRRLSLVVALLAGLAGCRIQVDVPAGGAVTSASGVNECAELSHCEVEVTDTGFADTFTAVPGAGYVFAGWVREPNGLCGGSLKPCELDAAVAAEYPALLALIESDDVYGLRAQFLPERDIRRYAAGDIARFQGSLTGSGELGMGDEQAVTARLVISDTDRDYLGFPVRVAELTVASLQGDVLLRRAVTLWQDERGASAVLADEFDNLLFNTAANEQGVMLVPAPLEPFARYDLPFSIMWGGHTSTPLASGARQIQVGEGEPIQLPMGDSIAYEVTVLDQYTYLVSYADFKKDQSVEVDRILTVSPAKGLVGLQLTQRVFSPVGKLVGQLLLSLELTGANF